MEFRKICAESRGSVDAAFHTQIARVFPPLLSQSKDEFDGIHGLSKKQAVIDIVEKINDQGFCLLEEWIAPDDIREIFNSLNLLPVKDMHGNTFDSLDSMTDDVARVVFEINDLMMLPILQRLATDETLIAIAEKYLGCQPILDVITAFANFPSTTTDLDTLSANAQLFHYDKDRLRFLKFFVFLSDIDEKSGPHAFVRQSHRKRPDELWHPIRFTDEEILSHYDSSEIAYLTGKAGTVLVADTMGIHKGVPVESGRRLIFQLQYSSSLFRKPLEILDNSVLKGVGDWRLPSDCPRLLQGFQIRDV